MVYQLTIALRAIRPPISRRFQVPASTTLDRLHLMVQRVMGWENYHLHEFVVGGRRYGTSAREWKEFEDDVLNERRFTLADIAPAVGTEIEYTYDFGDGWQHDIRVEKILSPAPGQHYPVCLAGARACPPEDCGGYPGYTDLVKAMADPRHARRRELIEWLGEPFESERFSAEAVSRDLLRFRRRARSRLTGLRAGRTLDGT
jgi:hypothetical protein